MQLWSSRIACVAWGASLIMVLFSLVSCGDDGPTDPPVTKGSIEVTANVTGASIFLNGADTGKTTDATLSDLEPGTYTVTVSLGTYLVAPSSIDVTVEAGKTETASFTLSGGFIAVTSDVAGALIYIDGIGTDRTTDDTTGALSPGTHTVRVELAGYTVAPDSLVVTVVEDSTSDASFTLTAAAAQSRKVIVEHYSNTSCTPCLEPDLAIEGAIASLGYDVVASFGVHLNWPALADPFFVMNSTQNLERGLNQLGVSSLPEVRIDGVEFLSPGDQGALSAAITAAGAIDPLYDIISNTAVAGDSLVVSGSVYKRGETTGTDLITAVILETDLHYDAENGLDHFNDVARRFLPGTDGDPINLATGATHTFRYAVEISSGWDLDNLETVVIVESASTRVIYQGAGTQ